MRTIPRGEAALQITLTGVKRARIRCQDCSGPAPPDLPPLRERTFESSGFTQVGESAPSRTRGALKTLANNWMPYRDSE